MKTKASLKQLRRQYWDRRWAELGRVFKGPSPKKFKKYVRISRERALKAWLKATYGLTVAEYQTMRTRQGNRCLICDRPESELKKPLQIDHHHKTGKVRGLLCYGCNVVIGMAREDPHVLKMCALYLEIHAQHRGN